MTRDLADRPVLGEVQAMKRVDLFGGQHGCQPRIRLGVAETRGMFLSRRMTGCWRRAKRRQNKDLCGS
jgi:hypothetical protein